jgi:hypothetical protein
MSLLLYFLRGKKLQAAGTTSKIETILHYWRATMASVVAKAATERLTTEVASHVANSAANSKASSGAVGNGSTEVVVQRKKTHRSEGSKQTAH